MQTSKNLDHQSKKLLDRQLRLFGRKLQTQLLNSKVLISGLSQTNLELAKNLVLKALNIDIYDSGLIDQAYIDNSFLFEQEHLGKNVNIERLNQKGEIAKELFSDMNPIISINNYDSLVIDTLSPETIEKLKSYDLLVIDTKDFSELVKIQFFYFLDKMGQDMP